MVEKQEGLKDLAGFILAVLGGLTAFSIANSTDWTVWNFVPKIIGLVVDLWVVTGGLLILVPEGPSKQKSIDAILDLYAAILGWLTDRISRRRRENPPVNLTDVPARVAVALIFLFGPSFITIAILTHQLFLGTLGGLILTLPFIAYPRLRGEGLDHPRPITAGVLCLLGILFLGYLTPLFGSFFVTQPTISSISNRLVFAVAWQPVNNYPQIPQVTFNTVLDQLAVMFVPNGFNDYAHRNATGILYITEPFVLKDEPFQPFGNWTFGPGTQVFGPGGWHIRLDYNYNFTHLPCGNAGINCKATFDTESLVRTDLNGAISMEIQYTSLNSGNVNICGVNPCFMTGKNLTADVLIAVPHDTSSLQATPPTSKTIFNQAYTNLEWDNLTSAVVMSYISPPLQAQYQFFILTSGILISTGVAMEMDAIAKWIHAKNRKRQKTNATHHEVQSRFF